MLTNWDTAIEAIFKLVTLTRDIVQQRRQDRYARYLDLINAGSMVLTAVAPHISRMRPAVPVLNKINKTLPTTLLPKMDITLILRLQQIRADLQKLILAEEGGEVYDEEEKIRLEAKQELLLDLMQERRVRRC